MNRTSRQRLCLLFIMLVSFWLASVAAVQEVWADTTGNLVPANNGGLNTNNAWVNTAAAACIVDGTNCYTEVDDPPGSPDGDTSYVRKTGTVNTQDITFDLNLSSIPDNSTITAVAITFTCRGEGQTVNMRSERRVDGVQTVFGTNATCPSTYGTFTQNHTGLSITKLATTDFEIGVRNNQTRVARVTSLYAVITYTPPVAPTTTTLGNGAAEPSSVTIPPENAAVMIEATIALTGKSPVTSSHPTFYRKLCQLIMYRKGLTGKPLM